jgi:hypothetical protein
VLEPSAVPPGRPRLLPIPRGSDCRSPTVRRGRHRAQSRRRGHAAVRPCAGPPPSTERDRVRLPAPARRQFQVQFSHGNTRKHTEGPILEIPDLWIRAKPGIPSLPSSPSWLRVGVDASGNLRGVDCRKTSVPFRVFPWPMMPAVSPQARRTCRRCPGTGSSRS